METTNNERDYLKVQNAELSAALADTMREFINIARGGMTPAQDAAYARASALLRKVSS